MNQYGQLAQTHWMQWLPARYSEIEDTDRYFTVMGLQIQSEVDTIYSAMTAEVPETMAPDQVEGWKNMARKMAEEKILAEVAYLPPETEMEEDWLPEEPGWRDRWPDTIITDVIQESYDHEADQPLS
jgi:hypothetical protein